MVEAKASPADIVARVFETDAERLATMQETVLEPVTTSAELISDQIATEPMPHEEFVKLFEVPAGKIVASNSGLREEAQALAEIRERGGRS